MVLIRMIAKFFMRRAQRLFGLILVITLMRPAYKLLLWAMDLSSGFLAMIVITRIRNPEVHGVMTGAVVALIVSLIDKEVAMGHATYLNILAAYLVTIFVLDAINFEIVSENKDLAKRARRIFRIAMWTAPLIAEILSVYVFHTTPYLIEVTVDLWVNRLDLVKQIFGGP